MPTQREVDEARIRGLVDKIVDGLQGRDLEGLRRLYATDVVSFDIEPPLQHVGIEAKLKNWTAMSVTASPWWPATRPRPVSRSRLFSQGDPTSVGRVGRSPKLSAR